MSANRFEVLWPQRERKTAVAVLSGENPLQVRIRRWVQFGQCVMGTLQDALGDLAFHIAEKLRIATQPAQQEAREEESEQRPPAHCVPFFFVETVPLRKWLAGEQSLHTATTVDQGQHTRAEDSEEILKSSGGSDTTLNHFGVLIPVVPCCGRQMLATASVQFGSVGF